MAKPSMSATSMPEIAVIISTYNKPDDLRCVLEGYRLQSDQNFAIYVADDGSGEETRALVETCKADFPVAIHHVWHEDNGFRLSEIRNRAILAAREPYILITDGDCVPMPGLIRAHRKLACAGAFLTGSRLLLSESISDQVRRGRPAIPELITPASLFALRRLKLINRAWPLRLPSFTGPANEKLSGLRGCHMSFWREDLNRINGYDQSFTGWGREDSDIAARLFHAGIRRKNLYGTPLLHLWHHENPRDNLDKNDEVLKACLDEKRIEARSGLKQLAKAAEQSA